MHRAKQQRMQQMKVLSDKQLKQQKEKAGNQMIVDKTERLKLIMDQLNQNLQKFAKEYTEKINNDPNFRKKFNELCNELGIDPIVSSKTIWSQLGFGKFYNELGMRILSICVQKKQFNGGLMSLDELIVVYQKQNRQKINKDDITKAIGRLQVLGKGCEILKDKYICSVPFQISDDTETMLEIGEQYGLVSCKLMNKVRGWSYERFQQKIEWCVQKGLVWEYDSVDGQISYYFASQIEQYIRNKQLYLKRQNELGL